MWIYDFNTWSTIFEQIFTYENEEATLVTWTEPSLEVFKDTFIELEIQTNNTKPPPPQTTPQQTKPPQTTPSQTTPSQTKPPQTPSQTKQQTKPPQNNTITNKTPQQND